jgi:hypothetical protein
MNKPIVDNDIYPVEGSKNLQLDRYHGPTFLSTSMPFNMTIKGLLLSFKGVKGHHRFNGGVNCSIVCRLRMILLLTPQIAFGWGC